MSQIFFIKALVFILFEKNGKLSVYFLKLFFPNFHKTKTRSFKKHLRQWLNLDLNRFP